MDSFKINRIAVKNFKSLADFEIKDLPNFICLIGINGAGKTTLLQLLSFVRALMNGKVSEWITDQGLESVSELLTIGPKKNFTIEITIDATMDETSVSWTGKFNTREMKCTSEILHDKNAKYVFSSGKLNTTLTSGEHTSVDLGKLKYEGSVFSLYHSIFGDQLRELRLFGVLNPRSIAQSTRVSSKEDECQVGEDGKYLCGFVANLPTDKQQRLFEELKQFYSPLKSFEIKKRRFGWKSILLSELEKTAFSATNLSYGTLRLYLILSQQYSANKVVLFDEVENGLNQELFGIFAEKLLNYGNPKKQVFITTHSGLLLNYLPDENAKESVYFLYKDKDNYTRVKRFFEIPMMQEKLNVMGPGEAMGDTDLVELSANLRRE